MLQQKLKLQDWTKTKQKKEGAQKKTEERDPLVYILTQESYNNTKLETIIYKQRTWYITAQALAMLLQSM